MKEENNEEEQEALEFIEQENYHSSQVRALQRHYDQERDILPIDMEGNQRESYWPQRELHASPFAKHLIKNAQQKKENIVKPEVQLNKKISVPQDIDELTMNLIRRE